MALDDCIVKAGPALNKSDRQQLLRSVEKGLSDVQAVQQLLDAANAEVSRLEEATPSEPGVPTNGIDTNLTAVEKADALHALGRENQPAVDRALARIDEQFGFTSNSNSKALSTIVSKSQRPEFRRKNGNGAGVEHVRDSFRFRSVLQASGVADIAGALDIMLEETGATVLKSDFSKIAEPEEWGWRMVAFDLSMPNGQIVEWYLPLTEMNAAQAENHKLFSKWRDKDVTKLTATNMLTRRKDVEASRSRYDAAFQASAESAGLTSDELVASFTSLEASLSSRTAIQPSLSSSPESGPSAGAQVPATRISEPSETGLRTSTSEPSRDFKTSVVTDEIVPQQETQSVTNLEQESIEPTTAEPTRPPESPSAKPEAPVSEPVEEKEIAQTTATATPEPATEAQLAIADIDQDTIDAILKQYGEEPLNSVDAERRWSDGDVMFAVSELDEKASIVTSIEMLRAHTSDRLLAVPRAVFDEAIGKQTRDLQPQFTELAGQRFDAVMVALRTRLKEVGISDKVVVRLTKIIRDKDGNIVQDANARYFANTIEIALSTRDKMGLLNHELIHLFRDLGVIRGAEWKALSGAVKAEGMDEIRQRYAGRNLSEEQLVEEAVADMHADWAADQREAKGFLRTAFQRISDFLEALGNVFRGAGFNSAGDIFRSIGSGEIGGRRTETPTGTSLESFQVAFHGSPNLFKAFDAESIGTGQGVAAFGTGLYFAEDAKVAEVYRAERGDGVLYEVEIPDESVAQMLDWDAPLSQQPVNVQKAVNDLIDEMGHEVGTAIDASGDTAFKSLSASDDGADFYNRLEEIFRQKRVDNPGKEASRRLLAAGVPGIRYLDAGSRSGVAAGGGFIKPLVDAARGVDARTRNLVVFDDSIITIKKINGKLVTGQERFALRRGDFDPQAARKAAKKADRADSQSSRFFDEAIFRFQDKFNYLYKAQKAAARERGLEQVPEAEDAYLAELRYHGMLGAAIEDFQSDHVEPLVELISKNKIRIEDLDRYLHARHAPEANAQLKRINPDRENNEALSGMSDEEAATVMDDFETDGILDQLKKITVLVDEITKMQRNILVTSGLESEATIEKWEETYQFYAPLHRDGFDGRETPSRGKGFSVAGKQKRRVGSEREVINVLAQVVAQHETTIVRAAKNKVAQILLEFAKANPNKGLYEVDKAEFTPSFDAEGLVTYVPQTGFQFADNVVAVKVDGNDHTITFNAQNREATRIAYAVRNMSADHSGPIINTLMVVTRYLALVSTAANPAFIISNFARDIQTAGYNLSDTEADKLKWRILKDVGKAWRGIRAFQNKKSHAWAGEFDRFRKAGAKTGWLEAYADIAQREKQLNNQIKELSGSSSALKIKKVVRSIFKLIENENNAVENAVRLSAFVHVIRNGGSEAMATRIAKELTVNFNRKGDYGQVMNALWLFYNASVQGSARMIIAAYRSPKVRKLIGATIVAAMFLDLLNRAMGGEDDDGKDRYDKVPDYVKERNLVIMRPDGAGDYWKIPLPWGYNVFHVMGQVMGEALTKSNFKTTEGAMRVVGAIASSFNPVGGEGSLAQMISPTITDPIVQWGENKDWVGRPLRPEGNPFDVDEPKSQKYWNSVRETSRWVTEKLNELTGGNEIRPGTIDINPELIDLLIDTFTGGAGRFFADLVATPIKALQGKEIEVYEIPLLRKVYGRPGMGALFEEYYHNTNAVRITEKEARHYIEIGDRGALATLKRERRGEYSLIDSRRKIDSGIQKLRQRRNKIEASKLSEIEKRAKLDEVSSKMQQLMNRFNRLYNQRVGE